MIVESQKKAYYERENVIKTLITMAKSKLCSKAFQILREQYNAGTLMYDEFLNSASYTSYKENVSSELHRARENSLFGASTKEK